MRNWLNENLTEVVAALGAAAVLFALACAPDFTPTEQPAAPPLRAQQGEVAEATTPLPDAGPLHFRHFDTKWKKWEALVTYTHPSRFKGRICICAGEKKRQHLVGSIELDLPAPATHRVDLSKIPSLLRKPNCFVQCDLTNGRCDCPGPVGGPVFAHHVFNATNACPEPTPTPPPCVWIETETQQYRFSIKNVEGRQVTYSTTLGDITLDQREVWTSDWVEASALNIAWVVDGRKHTRTLSDACDGNVIKLDTRYLCHTEMWMECGTTTHTECVYPE
jgi:hypothetical protein